MTYTSAERLVVARATRDDWPVISGWAYDEGWNPGLRDEESFFAQDPAGFFLGCLDGDPVSAISLVNYGDGYAFLGCYLVRPDQRGRGYGSATWRAGLAHAGARTLGLDGVVAQQDNYRRSGFTPAHRTVRHVGRIGTGERPAHVRQITAADRAAVAAYDSACWPADRPRFLDRWLTTQGHRALVRVVDGRLTGFAVLRPARETLRIGPLFADSPSDARALYAALAAEAGPAQVAVDVPDANPAGVALAQSLGLTPAFETARMYTGPIRPLAEDRVYGVTTLELG
ncbi:GNAT family N-acetyltransferase [Streptomyces sp. NPDC051320]|uniref:GNAT family N-acetyltransferase n=1 Tax=Streptomyces sp. NPDC051320 TaxID=3154644 RepID=UPI003425B330